MDFIRYLPIKQKYKDVLINNFSSDLSLFRNFGIISLQKFILSNGNNDYDDFIKELHEYTISFIGYTTFILDREILPGVGYGISYILLNEFYKEYKKKNEILKQDLRKKYNMVHKNFVITVTFGEVAENHVGMEKLGLMKKPGQGINLKDLKNAKKIFKEKGYEVKIYDLVEKGELENMDIDPAYVMVIKNGINALIDNGKDDNLLEMNKELLDYEWDKKAFMRGRVVNKLARYNLNYADFDQEPDYSEKKGKVVNFKHVPLLSNIRKNIPEFLGSKTDKLFAEGNFYYDLDKCGIGFHGDAERRIVVAARLGDSSIPIHYQWFQRGLPIGKRIILKLNPGDVYIMSEKAVGTDWMKKIVPTLRHATGCLKYTEIKEKKK